MKRSMNFTAAALIAVSTAGATYSLGRKSISSTDGFPDKTWLTDTIISNWGNCTRSMLVLSPQKDQEIEGQRYRLLPGGDVAIIFSNAKHQVQNVLINRHGFVFEDGSLDTDFDRVEEANILANGFKENCEKIEPLAEKLLRNIM